MIGGSTLRIPGILTIVLLVVGIATRSSAMLIVAIPPMVYLAASRSNAASKARGFP